MSKTIGLSMIVKNEIHVLKRLLESIYPILDYWVVVDTGSTDGTQQLVKDFFTEKNIPGELIEIQWENFATSRNIALKAVEDKVDYGFWIDADEELMIHPAFSKDELFATEPDSASLKTIYGKVEYTRKNIWKTKKNFSWNGPIHELLGSVEEKSGVATDKLSVVVRPEGNSWGNVIEKYSEHAKILEAYCATNDDPRWIFYTAQSYRDSQQFDKSIEWYNKRAEIKDRGFVEEVFISKFMVAKLSEATGKELNHCIQLYQDAHAADPARAEAVAALVQMYQRHKNWEMSYVFSKYALQYNQKNPYPYRILFIEKPLYDYQILELHSLSCFYTGRKEEGSWAYWQMRNQLIPGYLAPEQDAIVKGNEQYFDLELAKKFGNAMLAGAGIQVPKATQLKTNGFRLKPNNPNKSKKKSKR